jgi:hypothetical protein
MNVGVGWELGVAEHVTDDPTGCVLVGALWLIAGSGNWSTDRSQTASLSSTLATKEDTQSGAATQAT